MADILPTRPDQPSDGDKEPRVVGLDSEEVSELLSAISSDTAREILSTLHDEPATPSEVADAVDTTIQNAQYHLGKLEDAGLIEPGGTAYSEKGREMTVYAPADRALVVVAGKEDDTSGLKTVLSQLLGGLGAVALGSVVVERLTAAGGGPSVSLSDQSGSDGGDGGAAPDGATTTEAAEPTRTPAPEPTDAPTAESTAVPDAERTEAPDAEPTAEPTPTRTEADGGGGFDIAEATGTETAAEARGTPTEAPAAETGGTPVPTEEPTAAPTGTVADAATETATEVATTVASGGDAGLPALAALSPPELFFLGGVATLVAATAYWWLRS